MKFKNFNLEKWYVKYEFSSKYNLSASGVYPLELSYFDLNNLSLSYSEAQGNYELRKLISDFENTSDENILITNGAIEALFLVQLNLFNPNDNIIVIKPTYPAIYQIAKDIGVNIIDLKLKIENNFNLDLEQIESLSEICKPKAIIINYPNNPTGKDITEEELLKLIEIARKNDSYIISDEVYSLFREKKIDITNYYDKSIVINSMSKVFRIPGSRIGWIKSNKEIILELMNLRHYTTLCNNILGEQIAQQAILNRDKILKSSQEISKKHKEITLDYLQPLKEQGLIDFIIPDIGVMIFIKLNFVDDAEKFCEKFEKETSILLLPANKYNKKYKNFIRLGFGIEEDKLKYCLEKFIDFINKVK